jgi:hypothetical protein
MPRGSLRIVAIALALAVVWACETKSPAEPTRPAACTYTLSTASLSFAATAGTGSVTVTTGASCTWTAASDRAWMHVDSAANAVGPGTVTVSVTANTETTPRTGTLAVAGQTVAVTQDGAPACSVTLAPASASFSKDAASGSFTVAAPAACGWHATSGDAWIAITSGADGTGSGMVAYAIPRNTAVEARSGAVHVADAVFSISQAGDPPAPACEFRVEPVQINACMSVPYELSTLVMTQASCAWTAASDTPWIAIVGGASRSGPGELRFRIGDNYDAPRLGAVKVRWDTPTAGQNVQVSQAGCRYAVSTAAINAPAAGGAFTFDVIQESDPLECGGPLQNGCVWTALADASWVTITTAMPRAGDDRVAFTVAPNGGAARTARIAVRDRTVLISQDGR